MLNDITITVLELLQSYVRSVRGSDRPGPAIQHSVSKKRNSSRGVRLEDCHERETGSVRECWASHLVSASAVAEADTLR